MGGLACVRGFVVFMLFYTLCLRALVYVADVKETRTHDSRTKISLFAHSTA